MPFRPDVHVPLILAGVGVIFAIAGALILFSDAPKRNLERGAALGTVTAPALRFRPTGEVMLLEGRLAAGNRAVFRDFVACQRDRYAGVEASGASKGRERWVPLETMAPPLEIETADGVVAVVNRGYALQATLHFWRDNLLLPDLFGKYPERASGFIVGDTVTVEGRVVDVPGASGGIGARGFEATTLFGGDHAAYLAHLRGGVLAARILGGVFLGVGALLVVIAGLLLRRAGRNGNRRRTARR